MRLIKLSTNQWITSIISVSALVLSCLTLYFEHRTDNSVGAKIVDADLSWPAKAPFIHDTLIVSVAYSNLGNRQAVILTPWFEQTDTITTKTQNIEQWMLNNDRQFPFQMQPHESRLIKIKIPISAIATSRSKPKRSKYGDTTYTSCLALKYIALNSYLVSDTTTSNFDIEVTFTKTDITDVKMSTAPILPSIIFK